MLVFTYAVCRKYPWLSASVLFHSLKLTSFPCFLLLLLHNWNYLLLILCFLCYLLPVEATPGLEFRLSEIPSWRRPSAEKMLLSTNRSPSSVNFFLVSKTESTPGSVHLFLSKSNLHQWQRPACIEPGSGSVGGFFLFPLHCHLLLDRQGSEWYKINLAHGLLINNSSEVGLQDPPYGLH